MQKTSMYYKIRDILDAASKHSGGLKELAKSIKGNYESFVFYRKDSNGVVIEQPCDVDTIKRAIRFCIDLGLIEKERCVLTHKGRNARKKGRFDLQLQQAIFSYFEANKLKFRDIESAIREFPLPHVDKLYSYLSPSMTETNFRSCLYLLSVCNKETKHNVLKSVQKTLYLTDEKIETIDRLERELNQKKAKKKKPGLS
jgi:hypothetical protein